MPWLLRLSQLATNHRRINRLASQIYGHAPRTPNPGLAALVGSDSQRTGWLKQRHKASQLPFGSIANQQPPILTADGSPPPPRSPSVPDYMHLRPAASDENRGRGRACPTLFAREPIREPRVGQALPLQAIFIAGRRSFFLQARLPLVQSEREELYGTRGIVVKKNISTNDILRPRLKLRSVRRPSE